MSRPTPSPTPLQPNQRVFERYYLRRPLAPGGMSTVWLAHDRLTEQHVVLKFLPPELSADQREIERLQMEAHRGQQLAHPNIVQVFEFHSGNQGIAVAMEYVDGWSLWSMRVDRPGQRFAAEELMPWLRDLCAALGHAHAANVVHRDLKPANLILNSRGQLKLADFGLSRSMSPDEFDTGYYRVVGTDWYMSPQQWTGEAPHVADDIYSFGATVYELLTGKPPFHDGDIFTKVHQDVPPLLSCRLKELGVRRPKLPDSWDEIIADCLQKDANLRPNNVHELSLRLGI